MITKVKPFLLRGVEIYENSEGYLECPILNPSEGLKANIYYFNHAEWAEEYLTYCHRSVSFKDRWGAVVGDWSDKIVLDIGCGPGNIYATLQGRPKLLIGVDVAPGSLKLAASQGYLPLLADATTLPFISEFADIVMLNAALHHCEDMEAILKEAARVVKSGGLLITDHDPQLSAWNYKGLAKWLWDFRLLFYRVIGHGFHKTGSQQHWGLACEIHHKPGHGVTKEWFLEKLSPLGFQVNIYPHNHMLGREVLNGEKGRAAFKFRLGNWLSGRHPDKDESALSLMCVAVKKGETAPGRKRS